VPPPSLKAVEGSRARLLGERCDARRNRSLAHAVAECNGADERTIARPVLISDGGYALVEVRVFGEDAGEVVIMVEGVGEGEGHAAFRMFDDQSFHSGWFDLGPWVSECERDPGSRERTDVNHERAGTFIGLSRPGSPIGSRVTSTRSSACTSSTTRSSGRSGDRIGERGSR
jgi:hypothetical protein